MLLPKDRKEFIKNKAQEVLASAYSSGTFFPPIDLNKIVETNGLSIKKGSFANPQISGAYKKAERTIYISSNELYARQAFTVAHELGHFFLHADKMDEVLLRSNSIESNADPREAEANEFAANLLMPEDFVKRIYAETTSVAKIATLFGVSYTAMDWRIKNLGLK